MPDYSKRLVVPQSSLDIRPVSLHSIPTENRARFLHPGEIEIIVALVRSVRPASMVEFGCQNGRTSRVILDNCPSITRFVGVDVPASFVTPETVQRAECPERPGELAFSDARFRLLMAGRGSRDLLPADLGTMEVAFIDGDHSYEGVMNDFNLSVQSGAELVIFHDDHLLETVGVNRALDDLSRDHRVVHVEGTWLSYVKL